MIRITLASVAVAVGLAAGCSSSSSPKAAPPPPHGQPENNPKPTPPPEDKAKPAAAADDKAKETARKRLKDVILAWHEHDGRMGSLPTNTAPKAGVGLSWRVLILPMLKQEELFKKFKLDEPWDSENNKKLIDQMPDVYASAGKPAGKGQTYLRSFVGPHAAVPPKPLGNGPYPRGQRIFFPDGTVNTIVVAEAAEPVVWTKADDLPYDGGAVPKLGGPFDGGFHAARADAGILWFDKSVPEATIAAAITIDGAEVVQLPPEIPTTSGNEPAPVKPGPRKP